MKKLILASQSPRRIEILKSAGYQFVPFPLYVSEIPNKNLRLDEQIIDIARRKAEAFLPEAKRQKLDSNLDLDRVLVLAADTMVCLEQKTLGKPENASQAFEFLRLLSGKVHQVKTAIYLLDISRGHSVSHIETTDVEFKTLSDDEIKNYIATGEPLDKAGAYAIQGLGKNFVARFSGDFNNVVGLPLQALEKLFKLNGWIIEKTRRGL